VAIHLGWSKVPAVRGMQRLLGEIFARAWGKEFGGSNVARRIDVELYGHADGTADGGARPGGDVRHDLIEHFALGDRADGRRHSRLDARRIRDAGQSGR